jgi:hypothetical protein
MGVMYFDWRKKGIGQRELSEKDKDLPEQREREKEKERKNTKNTLEKLPTKPLT